MITFLQILANPTLGFLPQNADSIALGEITRQQLFVFRTAVDCIPAAPEMIRLEQAIVEGDPKAGSFIPSLASRLAELGHRHAANREVAMGRIGRSFKGGSGDAQEIAKLGEPLDVGIKRTDKKMPIRFRSVTPDVAIEEKLFFVRGGLSLFRLMGPPGPNDPKGRELVRFYPPHVEEGVLLYIGKQKYHEPIQITSEPPTGVPLGLQVSLKGSNGVGRYFVVGFRGDGRPKVDRADGLPNVGEGDVKLTLGDRLHIGDGYQLRLEPVEAEALRPAEELRAEPTRMAVAPIPEDEPPASRGVPIVRVPLRTTTPDPLANRAAGFHFGRLPPLELKPGEEIILGRRPPKKEGTILDPFEYISREHVRIHRDLGGDFWIEDLGSKNGTSVQGVWLKPHRKINLRRADFVKLGPSGETFIFDYWMPEEPRRTTSTPPAVSLQPSPSVATPLPSTPPREMTPVPMPGVPTTWLWLEMAVAPGDSNSLIFSSWLGKWWEKLRRLLNF